MVDDGRTPNHGHPISSGELKMLAHSWREQAMAVFERDEYERPL